MDKNKKRKIIAIAVITMLALISVGVYLYKSYGKNLSNTPTSLIRQCPDSWTQNDMPTIINPGDVQLTDEQRQSFIIDGEKKDITKYDIEWVKSQCPVKLVHAY